VRKLGGLDKASLEAVMVRVWRCPWRPYLCEFGDTLGGQNQESLEAVIV